MKRIVYSTIACTLAVLSITGCEKMADFGDTNVNPEATENPSTSGLLTNVLSGLAKYSCGVTGSIANPAAIYCQYTAETYIVWHGLYDNNRDSPMGYYSADLYDLQNIIDLNTNVSTRDDAALNGDNENQIAIARILKAYIYWYLTDCWGDVPYKEALKQNPKVSYDTQESIYKDLINELSEAVAQITSENSVKGDFVYDGDMIKWRKLANSLRMLISLRLSKQYPLPTDYAAIQFQSALENAAGSIEANESNFQLIYPGGNFKNPYYIMYDGSSGEVGESATMTSLLDSLNNDQRQTVFGSTATGEPSSLGVPVGISYPSNFQWCQANPDYCYIFHPDYRQQTSPVYLITASHVLLARAEAADRGWTSETPNTTTLYQEGITQSFLQWGLDAPDASYFNSTNVALPEAPGSGANLKQIATQQYVAYYPNGVQGWCTWRKTGFPTLSPAPDAVNIPPAIARRFMYGLKDYENDSLNVQEAVDRLPGGDEMESRVWWDREN